MDTVAYTAKILECVEKLPPMPDSIITIRRLCANPDTSYTDLIPIMEKDPALCADILHLVNSAWYGLNHRVERVSEALRVLGLAALADFASVSFSNSIIRKHFIAIPNLGEYFEHSRQVSQATRILAINAGRSKADQEFLTVAGLLHDIGRLVILLAGDTQVRSLLGTDWKYVEDLHIKENELLGLNHCFVGKEISLKWNFSDKIQKAILDHHTPVIHDELSPDAALILLGHFVSMTDFPVEMLAGILTPELLEALKLSPEKLAKSRNDFLSSDAR